jgi:hypothetical protein
MHKNLFDLKKNAPLASLAKELIIRLENKNYIVA